MTTHNPTPWVVVSNAGKHNEDIVIDFPTFREACDYVDANYSDDEPLDILRRNNDGTLTTEY